MDEATRYGESEITDAFLEAQHADFSRSQIERMVADAKRNGQSRDFGDGYMIFCSGGIFTACVNRKYI